MSGNYLTAGQLGLLILLLVGVTPVSAQTRTHVVHFSKSATLYALNCAACHGHSGRSSAEFPTLVNRIGYYARSAEGRAYIAQVPGVAMSAISDADLAAMLNWLLKLYSAKQLPADFKDYTGAEVAVLRQVSITPRIRRKELIESMLAAGLIPSATVLEWSP